jgi:glycosyltransferase involved in cell wall biosynthesis
MPLDLPRTIIAHPGRQHSHQTALALQEGGMLERYLTSVWYQPNRFPYSVVRYIPGNVRRSILSELKKRSFEPLDLSQVETYPFWKLLYTLARKVHSRQAVSERSIHKFNRDVDEWVAGKLSGMKFDLFIGYEVSALECFRVCKQKGIPSILDLAAEHWTLQERMIEEEALLDNPLINIDSNLLKDIREIKEQELLLADFILTPSSSAKESLIKGGLNKQKVIQIPYGVDLSLFRPEQMYKRSGRFTVLYVGAITARKGLKYLLEAFTGSKLHDAELILIGGMAGGKELLKRYEGNYTYLPFLHHEELVRFYQQADLFVFPSLLDSFGMVVIEAMACGTPVVVSENTGVKDAVRDGIDGYVVPIRDVQALKQRIGYLYEHREKIEEMGRNARKQAEKYSWERYRERIREIVTKISLERKHMAAICNPV